MRPHELTPKSIMAESNTEVRRVAIERFGWDRFVPEADLSLVNECPDPANAPHTLSLYDVPPDLLGFDARVVLCTNASPERDGTVRRFGLTVPADMPDALTAVSWMFNVSPEQYATRAGVVRALALTAAVVDEKAGWSTSCRAGSHGQCISSRCRCTCRHTNRQAVDRELSRAKTAPAAVTTIPSMMRKEVISSSSCTTAAEKKAAEHEYQRAYQGQQGRHRQKKRAYHKANKADIAEKKRAYREANKADIAEKQRAYYEANKADIAEKKRAYREANKADIAEKKRAYREANKANIAEKQRAYYEANKADIAEKQRAYYEANKADIAEKKRAYYEANKADIAEKQRASTRPTRPTSPRRSGRTTRPTRGQSSISGHVANAAPSLTPTQDEVPASTASVVVDAGSNHRFSHAPRASRHGAVEDQRQRGRAGPTS